MTSACDGVTWTSVHGVAPAVDFLITHPQAINGRSATTHPHCMVADDHVLYPRSKRPVLSSSATSCLMKMLLTMGWDQKPTQMERWNLQRRQLRRRSSGRRG